MAGAASEPQNPSLGIVSTTSRIYALARSKSISWTVVVTSLVALATIVVIVYFRFVLQDLPIMG